MNGFLDFIRTSFFHVAPILLAGAIAAAIVLERARALFSVYPLHDSQGFFDRITDLCLAGKTSDAVSLCDRYPAKPAVRVVKQALLRAHQPESLIEHGLQIAVGDARQLIQRRTGFLATIANVATLLGLLGTIAGLIASFEAVGHADPQQKSALLAAGISTAMNATMLGLGVAIPCMVAYSFLMNRQNRLVAELDQAAIRSLDILKQRFYRIDQPDEMEGGFSSDDEGANDGAEARAVPNGKARSVIPMRRAA